MAAPLEPERLAQLVDLAERPRDHGWSMRAGLCRYAQPQPERAAAVLSLVRRVEAAFSSNLSELRADGPHLLARAESPDDETQPDDLLVGLIRAAAKLDDLGDTIATWAVDRTGDPPDLAIDKTVDAVDAHLAEMGIAEETPPPRGMRGRG